MEQEKLRLLVVGAHPDDVDFSTAGAMIKMAREGHEVFYVICTNGSKGGSGTNLSPEELINTRKQEQEAAAAIVGAQEVFFLGYDDGELVVDRQLRKELVRVIRKVRPHRVFCFDPGNTKFDSYHLFHSDHRASGLATFDAVYPAAGNRLYFPELQDEGLEPYRVPEMWFYGTAEPSVKIDISDVMEEKLQVIRCHKSQFNHGRLAMVEEFVRTRSRDAAGGENFEFAEVFRTIAYPF